MPISLSSSLLLLFNLRKSIFDSHDYEAENPGELTLRRHDVVIVRETRGEWWRGINAHGKKVLDCNYYC
jgi:hypothetical protein